MWRSSLENTWAPLSCSNSSLMLGSGYLFFIVFLFMDDSRHRVGPFHPSSSQKNSTTPRRRTRSDETHSLLNIELLLQLLQLFRSELVRTFAHRFRARLKFNNEFNWPVRRHSWKLFWKDVLIFANDWNLRDGIQFTLLIEGKQTDSIIPPAKTITSSDE